MKLLFVCQPNSHHFAEPYLSHLTHSRAVTRDYRQVQHAAGEYDVVWIEWANSHAINILSGGHLGAFTIVRIHDWEIRRNVIQKIPWENVDAVWFINPDAQDDFNRKVGVPLSKQFFLPNAVDLSEWPLVARGSKHLGIVTANVQPRKRLDRAIDLMRLLPKDYQMTIRTSPDPHPLYPHLYAELVELGRMYVEEGSGGTITLELRPFVEQKILTHRSEIVDFWRDKSHAVSVASHEGFCYGVAEGMACGAAGAVLNWEWGKPRTFYNCVEDDLERLAERIEGTRAHPIYRTFMEPFSAQALAPKLEMIIEERRHD